jgi:uncharacterized protein
MSSEECPFLDARGGLVYLSILLAPRSKHNKVVGMHGGRLKIAVTAPPVDGKANKLLISYLAERLACPKGAICIEKGETSREKLVCVSGLKPEMVLERLGWG